MAWQTSTNIVFLHTIRCVIAVLPCEGSREAMMLRYTELHSPPFRRSAGWADGGQAPGEVDPPQSEVLYPGRLSCGNTNSVPRTRGMGAVYFIYWLFEERAPSAIPAFRHAAAPPSATPPPRQAQHDMCPVTLILKAFGLCWSSREQDFLSTRSV